MSVGPSPKLSACIITQDEQRDLPGCLATLGFCDEIVVVDSGSTDDTIALAEGAGARVLFNRWPGFGPQRNVALDHARGEWVLEIDADERITDPLRREIEAFVQAAPGDVDLAAMPRREVIAGHALGPSAKYPNYRHRLLRRGAHRHDERRLVHEDHVPHGPVHPFTGELHHLTAPRWRDVVADTWAYARLEAGQLTAEVTPRAVVRGAVIRPVAKAAYRTVLDGGWRDGAAGLAKIALDCGADSVVWLRAATGRRTLRGSSGVTSSLHYGARRFPRGPAHVVAVACGVASTRRAVAWSSRASTAGLDVVLVTDTPAPALLPRVRTRPLRGGIIGIIRALDAEEQLRTIDAVAPFGRTARAGVALSPPLQRGLVAPVPGGGEPGALAAAIQRGREALAR